MASSPLEITPLTPALGAEISGVDLGQALDVATEDAVYRALLDHLVIFFRDQDITPERHLAFAKSFGTIDDPHPLYAHVPGFEPIVMLANDAGNPPDTDVWHTDLTFKQDPPFASILIAREVPESGGDTLWTSLYAAYESLPDDLKAHLEPLSAIHDMGDFRNNFSRGESSAERLTPALQDFGCAIHGVVQTHPVTKRKFLYVNEAFTVHIVGKTARESRALLALLLDHIDRPEHQVRFKWRPGSIAMWDNRCTQHYAVSDYLPARRCMNRVTVVRDRRALADLEAAQA